MNLPDGMIPGSWDARAWEAVHLLKADDPQGLDLARKLLKRLESYSDEQKFAGEGKLFRVELSLAKASIDYFVVHDRYNEAIELDVAHFGPFSGEKVPASLIQLHARLLRMAGDEAGAAELWQTWREAGSHGAADLAVYIAGLVELGLDDDVERALPEFDRVWLQEANEEEVEYDSADRDAESLDDEDDDSSTPHYRVLEQRIFAAIRQRNWKQAESLFRAQLEESDFAILTGFYLVEHMLAADETARAEALLDQLQGPVPIWYFLKGVAARRRGKLTKAEAMWTAALEIEPVGGELLSLDLRYAALAALALGDDDGTGLKNVLAALAGNFRDEWPLLIVAAIGWALRGNLPVALHNLRHASRLHRVAGYAGRMLPTHQWLFVTELLSPEQQSAFRPFFEPSSPPTAPTL